MNVWTLLGAFALAGAAALFYVGLDSSPQQPLLLAEGTILFVAGVRCLRRLRP